MRPYTRDKSTEYPERIQRLASEADGDLHEIGCAATNENDPDACNCVLRWWLERAAVPAAEAAPDAGLLDAEYVLGMMLEFQRLYGRLSKVPVEAVATMLRNAPAPASNAAPESEGSTR